MAARGNVKLLSRNVIFLLAHVNGPQRTESHEFETYVIFQLTHVNGVIDRESVIPKLRVLLCCPKVDLEARNSHGHTPLHLAVSLGNTSAVQLLLEHGANVNAANEK